MSVWEPSHAPGPMQNLDFVLKLLKQLLDSPQFDHSPTGHSPSATHSLYVGEHFYELIITKFPMY
jgi:hypothetical protein